MIFSTNIRTIRLSCIACEELVWFDVLVDGDQAIAARADRWSKCVCDLSADDVCRMEDCAVSEAIE